MKFWSKKRSCRDSKRSQTTRERSFKRFLTLEHLEDRRLLAVNLIYDGSGALELGDVDSTAQTVTIENTTNPAQLRISLGDEYFGDGSTQAATGLTYETAGNPTASHYAYVTIDSVDDVTGLSVNLGDGGDTISVALSSANVGDLRIDGGGGADALTFTGATSVTGDVGVSSETVTVNAALSSTGAQKPINIFADHVYLNANVTTEGGTVDVFGNDSVALAVGNSITTTPSTAGADGGSVGISVAIGSLTLEGSVVTTGAANAGGAGGNAGYVFVNTTGVISVAAITANGGASTGGVGGNAASIEVFSWDDDSAIVLNAVQLNGVLSAKGGFGSTAGADSLVSIMADGPIVDGSDIAAAGIVAGTAELIAGTGIATGSGADAQLEIDVTILAATTVTGNIHILDTAGGVTIGDSDPNPHEGSSYEKGVSITAATGDYDIVVGASDSGSITVGSPVTNASGGDVTLTAEGTINGAGLVTASVVDLNAATGIGNTTSLELAGTTITADATTGNVHVNNTLGTAVSLSSLTTGGGSVQFDQSGGGGLTTGTVSATTSATLTNSAGAIALNGSADAASLVVNASGAMTDGTTGTLAITGNANLTGSSITLGDDVGNSANFGSLIFNSAGAVSITEDSSTTVSGASTAGADLTLVSAGGVTFDETTNTTGNVAVTGTGTIDVNAKMTASGTILLDASDNITIDAAIDPTTVTLEADDDVTVSEAVSATTLITISAGLDGSGSATIALTGSLTTSAAGSDITISTGATSGDVTLTGTATAVDQVTVTSPAGSINGAGLVTASVVDLNAATGIGDATALELAASTITADNTTSGNIDIDNTLASPVTVSSLTTLLGGTIAFDQSGGGVVGFTVVSTGASGTPAELEADITLTNTGGNLTVGTSVTALGLGNILLTTITSGNVILTGTTTADEDQVTITSVGSLNGAGLVTASVVDLNAVTGIGDSVPLELAASTITADNTTSGNIDIDNTLASAVTVTTLTTAGGGTILFENAGAGGVSFGAVSTTADGSPTAGEDNITLSSDGGDLTITTSVTAAGAGDVVYNTTTAGNVILTGTTAADGDDVQITSVGAINGAGLVTASMADLNAATGIGNTTTVQTSVAVLDIDNATSGNVDIDETDAVTVFHAEQGTAGNIQIVAGGPITVSNGVAASNAVIAVGDGTITLKTDAAGSAIAVNSGVESATGAILIEPFESAGAGENVTVALNVTIKSTGSTITLKVADNLIISSGALVWAFGTLTVDADNTDLGAIDVGTGTTVVVSGTITGSTVTFNSGSDNDTFNIVGLGDGPLTVNAADGNDYVVVAQITTLRACEFNGGAGNDFLSGAAGDDALHGGTGSNTIYGYAGVDTIDVTDSVDRNFIDGGSGNDTITGGSGNDTVHGGAGNDFIRGGLGNDILYADSGNDILLGEGGKDVLYGGTGAVTPNTGSLLIGGGGGDRLYAQHGDMLISGIANFASVDPVVNPATYDQALKDVLTEWNSGNIDSMRQTTIKSGNFGLGHDYGVLSTSDAEAAVDYLYGSSLTDWFFDSVEDRVSGKAGADLLN